MPHLNPPGRKEDKALTIRLQSAMLETMAGTGLEQARLEDVVALARTSKQAIYRRWTSKEEMACSAVRTALLTIAVPVPERGNTARDLYRILTAYRDGLTGPLGVVLVTHRFNKVLSPAVLEFEDQIRFHMRQCLIASPFEQDMELRIRLLLGLLWHEVAPVSAAISPHEGSLEAAIYLVLGLGASVRPADDSL